MVKKKVISISIPVLNEGRNIKPLYERLVLLAARLNKLYEFEFIFTDNRSSDSTWEVLRRIGITDKRVKAIRFSQNVGFQKSILANFMHSKGDAVIQLDADMQDPPEMIEEFLSKWQEGYKVVYGVRKRRHEGFLNRKFRDLGYFLIDALSEHTIPKHAGDFRLIDRKIVDILISIKLSEPYLRGEIAGMGFSQIGVKYDRSPRKEGVSKFNFLKLVSFGMVGVLNHSQIPLRLASLCGFLILSFSVILSIYYLFLKLTNPLLPQGLASIHILVLFGIGFNAFFLGIIGEYLRKVLVIITEKPVAMVDDRINIKSCDIKL